MDGCLSGTHPCRAEGVSTEAVTRFSKKVIGGGGVSCLNDTRPCKAKAAGVQDGKDSAPFLNGKLIHLNKTKFANIYVEEGGTDNETCLNGTHPCKTFGYAVRVFHQPFSHVNGTFITVNYSHNFTVTANKRILQVSGLSNI